MGPAAYRWSVVIPAYNEAERLPAYLEQIVAYFDGRDEPYEVVVVDDGSADETGVRARELGLRHPAVKLHTHARNRGKGWAVRAGMLRAQGALRLMADADGATRIAEVERLEAAIDAGADVAIGSRALRDAAVIRQVRRHRQLAGGVFNLAVRGLGLSGVADTQCGFKLFRADVAEDLFAVLGTHGLAFDVELLLRAQRRGYRVAEVPVSWTDQPGSKVGVLGDGLKMLGEILVARWRLARHRGSRRSE